MATRRVILMKTYDELGAYVDRKNGVGTVSAGRLRDIHGAQRLGSEIREAIGAQLKRRGLGHHPAQIPDDHRQVVRVYRIGSPVGEIIRAVSEVGSENDKALRQAAKSPELIQRLEALMQEFA